MDFFYKIDDLELLGEKVAELLIEHGVNVTAINTVGDNALFEVGMWMHFHFS